MTDPENKSLFKEIFFPDYDELSLFSMSYILILFAFFSKSGFSLDVSAPASPEPGFFLIFFPFVTGMGLCIYHAFSNRRKTRTEKILMLLFAGMLNAFSGIWYGMYLLMNSPYYGLGVFPLWNIINGCILLACIRTERDFAEETISDENVSFKHLLVGTLVVTAVFLICHLWLELVWAATFSICMLWISNLNKAVNRTLLKLELLT